ncbi:MAG: hypothetical protein IJ774_12510 [Selenomonadaceae bacterium]|nr:hypothetical protein [Selenomonadaceae bacterium]
MTENPLYRRVYGYDNPLPQYRSIWQPPSDSYVMKKNRYPTAAQDLRNLFGSFFTPNYAVQYHPSPYQSEPFQTTYNPYSTNNISPAQQEINQRVSDALQSYTPPQPQPSPYQTTMPTYNSYNNNVPPNQQEINRYVQDNAISPAVDYTTQQLAQRAALGGLTLGAMYKYGKQYMPLAMAWLGTQNLLQPAVNGINRFANSPVGKTINKAVDKLIDFIW